LFFGRKFKCTVISLGSLLSENPCFRNQIRWYSQLLWTYNNETPNMFLWMRDKTFQKTEMTMLSVK